MATYVPPKRATEYIFYTGLDSVATAGAFQANPTLAAGDFKVSKDGGTLANLTTLPTVTPASGKMVKITVSATEMDADNVTVVCSDASGGEWKDLIINIQTAARQIDDLATPTNITAGTITTVTNLTNAPTNGDLTATMKASVTTAATSATPTVTLADGAITAAKIAADAITDAKVASDVTIASVTGAVGSVTSGVTVTTNNDKTGYALSSAGIQAIWDALTSALTTVGSIGKLLVDNINATISSRSSHTAAAVRTEMDSNSTQLAKLGTPAGASVSADIAAIKAETASIQSDTNDLQTQIGTAGAGLTAVASAANLATLTGYVDTEVAAIKAKTDNLPASPAATGDIPSANSIASAVWAFVTAGSYTATQVLRLMVSVLAGKSSGGGTTTVVFRDLDDTKDRIVATVDADGNRTAVVRDAT